MKKPYIIVFSLVLSLLFCCPAFAHKGATDSNGGHYDHSIGEYLYHHGYPAHNHVNGVCPYDYDDKTSHDVYKYNEHNDYSNSFVSLQLQGWLHKKFIHWCYNFA